MRSIYSGGLGAARIARISATSRNVIASGRRQYTWENAPRPRLEYEPSEGLEPLFKAETLNQIYNVYQRELLDRMRELTANTELTGLAPSQVMVQASQKPELAELFNVSSQAWNVDFFLASLSKTPRRMSPVMQERIRTEFGGMVNLETALTDAASGMFGSGWVWLVGDEHNKLKILPTYLTGTPMVPGRIVKSPPNMRSLKSVQTTREDEIQYRYIPLLGINCFEHAWRDFGIGEQAKRAYFKALFQQINWDAVFARMPQDMKDGL